MADAIVAVAVGERVRAHHLDYFRDLVAQVAERGDVRLECEAVGADGNVTTDGVLDTPYRHDAAVIANGAAETFLFESAPLLHFEPVTVHSDDLELVVEPFHWDYCAVRFQPARSAAELEPVRSWFIRWFRIDAEPGDDGFVSAVHYLSDPEPAHDITQLVTDLGTAPVIALQDLIEALRTCGARRIVVATPREP